uniref:Uncharacterized protein n=1 Tax=Arundo donax TaxID=35708 RepID=A0A0A9BLJ5_ARUDO
MTLQTYLIGAPRWNSNQVSCTIVRRYRQKSSKNFNICS